MKKIWFTIFVLCAAVIAFFIFYIPQHTDRNLVLYNSLVTYRDIVYKQINDDQLTLDIMMPTTEKYDKPPIIFYVHGGNFVEGDKSWMTLDIGEDLARRILDEGYAIISVNYRLLDETTHFPANIIDVKDSIRYINSVAVDYDLDYNNIGIWGANAGAYLALTVAYSPSGVFLGEYDLRNYPAEVDFVIDMYGPTKMSQIRDITSMTSQELAQAQSELNILYGEMFDIYNLTADDYDEMDDYDPISYVSIDTVPTIMVHGLADTVVKIQQSELLETKLLEYDIYYEFYKILGGENGLGDISESEVENVCDYVITFMKLYYVAPTQ